MIERRQKAFIESFIIPNPFFINLLIEKNKDTDSMTTYVFRCPLCGDSKHSRHKKRGALIYNKYKKQYKGKENEFFYTCYNCNVSLDFYSFLAEMSDRGLNLLEAWGSFLGLNIKRQTMDEPETNWKLKFYKLRENIEKYVTKLENSPRVFEYVKNRLIPEKYWNTKVFAYSGTLADFYRNDPLDVLEKPEVISSFAFVPDDYMVLIQEAFISGNLVPVGFALRVIHDRTDGFRYYKIPIKELKAVPFFSNLMEFNSDICTYPLWVLEGQVDALMFSNPAVAVTSGNLTGVNQIEEFKNNTKIFVFDNDYMTNPAMKRKLMSLGVNEKAVLWHLDKVNKYKDANRMITSGFQTYPIDRYAMSLVKNGLERNLWMKRR